MSFVNRTEWLQFLRIQITSLKKISPAIHTSCHQGTVTDQRYNWQRQGFPEGSSWTLKNGHGVECPHAKQSWKPRAMFTCLPELEVLDFGDQQLVVGAMGSHGCYIYKDQLFHRAGLIGCFRRTESAADFLVVVAPLVSAATGVNVSKERGDTVSRSRENATSLCSALTWL